MAEPVTLINSFEVPSPTRRNSFIAWEKTRDYLESPAWIHQYRPLHQAVAPNAEFQFVNIARWQTAEDFMTAIQSPGFREAAAGLAGYRRTQRSTGSSAPDGPAPNGSALEKDQETMQTWEAITSRRNVRSFDGRPIAATDLDRILEAGRQAPSSQNWQAVGLHPGHRPGDASASWPRCGAAPATWPGRRRRSWSSHRRPITSSTGRSSISARRRWR